MGKKRVIAETVGFLGRLRRDVRGNTLAFMAALLVPLAALSGSAIDVARMYAVKTRLQQACDAGALAGRKTLSDAGVLDTSDTGPAQSFFKNNFQSGWFKTNTVTFTPTKTSENQVSGTATATVPMAVMGMFGMGPRTVTVTCEARYDVADADIVFVLDTTGSMACLTSDSQSTCDSYVVGHVTQNADGSYTTTEKSGSRISGLRSAVASFYTTLTSQADPSTHFRFGFVPYSATVNVGHLLPTNYLATSWNYQSRWRQAGAADVVYQTVSTGTATTMTSAACSAQYSITAYDANDSATRNQPYYNSSTGKCTVKVEKVHPTYHYAQATNVDVSSYVQFSAVTNPAKLDGSKSTWGGCIEERSTTVTANPSTTSPPLDLDVDTAPSGASSQWGPLWPEIEYARNTTGASEDSSAVRTPITRYHAGGYNADVLNEVPCPKQAQRLATMSASDITNYLSASNGFQPYGVTYHDVGMTWGTRLLSPNGIFKDDTAAWPGHNPPNRYIVFLTDGAMEPDAYAYTSHGMETWDKRVTGSTGTGNLTSYHNARFVAACTIAKNHNITIFVIAYAQTMTSQLQSCASPGQAYYASDTAALNTAFSSIAKQVAMLRLSK